MGGRPEDAQHLRVAGLLASERVGARGQDRPGMKKKIRSARAGTQLEREIAAPDVDQLVAERHPELVLPGGAPR